MRQAQYLTKEEQNPAHYNRSLGQHNSSHCGHSLQQQEQIALTNCNRDNTERHYAKD